MTSKAVQCFLKSSWKRRSQRIGVADWARAARRVLKWSGLWRSSRSKGLDAVDLLRCLRARSALVPSLSEKAMASASARATLGVAALGVILAPALWGLAGLVWEDLLETLVLGLLSSVAARGGETYPSLVRAAKMASSWVLLMVLAADLIFSVWKTSVRDFSRWVADSLRLRALPRRQSAVTIKTSARQSSNCIALSSAVSLRKVRTDTLPSTLVFASDTKTRR